MTDGAGIAVLVEVANKIFQPAADATVRQFGYLVCYKSNINNLEQRLVELKSTKEDAMNFFKSREDNNEEPTNTEKVWLAKVEAMENAANDIKEAKTRCLIKWCVNPKQRYVLSRNAVKKAKEIQQLQIQGTAYVPESKPALPPSKLPGALANDGSKDFNSRAKIMDDIMEALKDDNVSIIGVCGQGGVGKTTLMHELRKRVHENDLFDEVAMATVSQNQDLTSIRCRLAEMLGLTRVKDGKNEIATADELQKRLTGKGRRTLVILDDIWQRIDLDHLGVPIGSDHVECKVILTSRRKDVCTQMKAQKTIPVAVMPPEEARSLFRKIAGGDCVESDDLEDIMKAVADECGGLPIALVTLARALSGKEIGEWRDALKQLREHIVETIPEMSKNVYSSIRMSYDFLASEQPQAHSLLLLCCQHPSDVEIQVERLVRYCLAISLFNNVDKVEDARNRVCSLIGHLKSCFLLEGIDIDNLYKNHGLETVKMNDLIRDVGISIVHTNRIYKQIVNEATGDVNEAAEYPNLKILVNSSLDGELINEATDDGLSNIRHPNHLIEGRKGQFWHLNELKVLDYRPRKRFCRLPAVENQTNLRMLSLENVDVDDQDSRSMIGRLTKLEILSFVDCQIGPFPSEIRQLSNLKLLDLRCVYEGKQQQMSFDSMAIASGILPQLIKLEILYLGSYHFLGKKNP